MKKLAIFSIGCLFLAHAQVKQPKQHGKKAVHSSPSTANTVVSCLSTNNTCPKLTINGDPDSTTAFHGKADPSIVKDPKSGTYWLGYSWMNAAHGASAIETHIAKSTDGLTYTYIGTLYPSLTVADPVSGADCYTSNEVVKLLPYWDGNNAHNTYWIVNRLNYCTPASTSTSLAYTRRLSFAVAQDPDGNHGPMCVNSNVAPCGTPAAPEWIGTTVNNKASWPIAYNFQTINAAMNACTTVREGTGIIDPVDGKLVWGFNCNNLHFLAQFVTNTAITAGNYVWTYVSGSDAFGTTTDATNVAGKTNCTGTCLLTEFDWSANAAGNGYGTVMSVINVPNGNRVSTGCVFAEMDMTSRPYTFKRTSGNINVDAVLTSPDSISGGPGSCTYGLSVVMAHKLTSPQITSYLMQSGLKP